jgi:hypothetical protein
MKKRSKFVSNSSSCSFIVDKDGLSDEDIERIRLIADFLNSVEGDNGANETENHFNFEVDYCLSSGGIRDFFDRNFGAKTEWMY